MQNQLTPIRGPGEKLKDDCESQQKNMFVTDACESHHKLNFSTFKDWLRNPWMRVKHNTKTTL